MKELSVYYCPHCGHYAYYQLSRNAVCPKCHIQMAILAMRFQDFMNLSLEERDELLSRKILFTGPSIVQRLMEAHKNANNRETIAALTQKIQELETENKHLNETVSWMHKTIWELIQRNKMLKWD